MNNSIYFHVNRAKIVEVLENNTVEDAAKILGVSTRTLYRYRAKYFKETQGNNMETKVCSRCGKELPLEAFGKNKSTKDGLNPLCKDCDHEVKSKPHKPRLYKITTEELLEELRRRKIQLSKVELTPREMMKKLYDLGYRGTLKVMHEVDLANM